MVGEYVGIGAFEGALLGLGVGSLETVGEVVGDKDGERLGLDEGQRYGEHIISERTWDNSQIKMSNTYSL